MTDPEKPQEEEDDIARLLRAAGPREQLPDELRQRWEQRFRTELETGRARRRNRWGQVAVGVAAGIVAVVVTLGVQTPDTDAPGPQPQVAALRGEVAVIRPDGGREAASLSSTLPSGSTIDTGEDGVVALAWGPYDLRINSGSSLRLEEFRVDLYGGEIYASDSAHAARTFSLQIDTPQGSVRDIGTQFTVAVDPGGTVATVRRGAIVLSVAGEEHLGSAAGGWATRVSVDASRAVRTEQAATAGEPWRWIYAATPEYELEGRSALAFLQWSVEQSGLALHFTNPQARHYAAQTLLHGSIGELDPERAVTPVLASTDLRAEIVGDRLSVSLAR